MVYSVAECMWWACARGWDQWSYQNLPYHKSFNLPSDGGAWSSVQPTTEDSCMHFPAPIRRFTTLCPEVKGLVWNVLFTPFCEKRTSSQAKGCFFLPRKNRPGEQILAKRSLFVYSFEARKPSDYLPEILVCTVWWSQKGTLSLNCPNPWWSVGIVVL